MKTIGFLISTKKNEKRRAILPEHIKYVRNKKNLFFEKGYGESLGIEDYEYLNMGAQIQSRNEVILNDIICDPKIGDSDYLSELKKGQTIFGWIHAVQNKNITDKMINSKISAIAWEDMFDSGQHVFWRNNELAGEAAVLHAFTLFGSMPYESNIALLGRGNTARGAYKTLTSLGANVTVYDKRTEDLLKKNLDKYDVFVNGILWDVYRKDHIIYREDLKRMKKPALIIDISCDSAGAIETSRPTSIEDPIYFEEEVMHYVVDHTPTLISRTVSKAISFEVVKYLDDLIEGNNLNNETIKQATIIEKGEIIDKRILDFQNRN